MKLDLGNINFDWARNIWQDLKNKNLLPVAALLLVALIAVPFVLGKKKEPVPTSAAIAVQADASPSIDEISVKQQRPNGQAVGGDPVNPFKQHPTTTNTTPTTSTTAAAPTTGSTGTSNSSTGTSNNSGTTKTKKSSDDASTAYKINVKFGTAGATKVKNNVAALTPFPSADDAYVVYLGAKDSGKTAVFLISTDVTATGDGICDPSEANCKTVEMAVGDTELFQVNDSTNTVASTQYELKVTKIHK